MGLLSDPEYGSVKWVKVLRKVHAPVCALCYIGAIVWFVMLGHREFNNETYFSENALLPGLVTNEFNGEHAAKQFYNDFRQELEDKYSDTDEMPVPWLVAKMSQLHLEVYTHNFTLNYPLGKGQVYKGTNVYGILRAARTSSLEALVVTAPYRTLGSHQKDTTASVALMLAVAQFATPQKYWAKDIIFLITEHEQLGMQAWLEAYHGLQNDVQTFCTSLRCFWPPGNWATAGSGPDPNKYLNPGKLKGRSGSIQAAINLEFHTPKIKYVEVKVEGLNGQLPNLDLVNLVHKLCVKSGIHHSYKNSYSWIRTRNKMDEWSNNVRTMLGMLTTQIPGTPNGNHGLFHRFNIEAVTLEGRDVNDPAGIAPKLSALSTANFHRLGVALESILRSLNNLLERFHQSYFFYMLAATNRFISIGQYMPCLCLMCVALLVRALYLWVSMQKDEDTNKQTDKKVDKHIIEQPDNTEENVSNVLGDNESETGLRKRNNKSTDKKRYPEIEKNVKKKKKDEKRMSIVNVGALYLLAHLIGYGIMHTPPLFTHIGAQYGMPTEKAIHNGLLILTGLTIYTPKIPRLLWGSMTRDELTLVNILSLVELATVCLSVGMHNFPLGLTMATVYTPLALMVHVPVEGAKISYRQYLVRMLCVIASPLIALILGMMVYSLVQFPEENVQQAFGRAHGAATMATTFAIVDSKIYGNWLFNVVTSFLVPLWILFWQSLHLDK